MGGEVGGGEGDEAMNYCKMVDDGALGYNIYYIYLFLFG